MKNLYFLLGLILSLGQSYAAIKVVVPTVGATLSKEIEQEWRLIAKKDLVVNNFELTIKSSDGKSCTLKSSSPQVEIKKGDIIQLAGSDDRAFKDYKMIGMLVAQSEELTEFDCINVNKKMDKAEINKIINDSFEIKEN